MAIAPILNQNPSSILNHFEWINYIPEIISEGGGGTLTCKIQGFPSLLSPMFSLTKFNPFLYYFSTLVFCKKKHQNTLCNKRQTLLQTNTQTNFFENCKLAEIISEICQILLVLLLDMRLTSCKKKTFS